MDYFSAHHSSMTSSPAMSATNYPDTVSLDHMSTTDENVLAPLWLNDGTILWDLDAQQDFEASLISKPNYHQITSHAMSPRTSQTQYNNTSDDGRKSSTGSTGSTSSINKITKRREQNRTSQRLFRERKITHVKTLEMQLEDLHERYQDLTVSFENQAKEKNTLQLEIDKLMRQLGKKA